MEDERNLAERAKAGDAEAFAKLYESVYADLYRTALYTLKNSADAEDVVSETVVAAFSSIKKLRSEKAFRGWIFRILSNKCCEKMAEYHTRRERYEDEPADDAAVGGHEEYVLMLQLFGELDRQERLIISLHVFGGYKGREIAKMLGMNENTVRSKESRGLKKLAEKWR